MVAQVRPTVIYTHSLHDVHSDHRNAHRAVMAAVREVGRVYCFQSPSATVDFRPSRFVAIDADIDRKLAAIGAFASQSRIRGYLDEDLIRSTARYWSRFGDSGYAEAFEVIRESEGLPMRQARGAGRGARHGRDRGGPPRGAGGPAGAERFPAFCGGLIRTRRPVARRMSYRCAIMSSVRPAGPGRRRSRRTGPRCG